jgi:hypothetical protein
MISDSLCLVPTDSPVPGNRLHVLPNHVQVPALHVAEIYPDYQHLAGVADRKVSQCREQASEVYNGCRFEHLFQAMLDPLRPPVIREAARHAPQQADLAIGLA